MISAVDYHARISKKIEVLQTLYEIEAAVGRDIESRRANKSLYEIPEMFDVACLQSKVLDFMIDDTVKIAQKIKDEINKQIKILAKIEKNMESNN